MLKSDGIAALRFFAVLSAVGLLALLAAACDGEDGGGGTTPRADETAAEGETPAADGGDEGDGGGGDGGLADLVALASEAAEGAVAKVSYSVITALDGEIIEQEWLIVQRPPDSRFEVVSTDGGQEIRTIIISAGGESYFCTSASGLETCLATDIGETEAQTASLAPLLDVPGDLAAAAEDVDLTGTSERDIAGLAATCFTVNSDISGLGEGEVCFSEDGLLLFLRSETNGAGFTFEATSVSTDVTDEDFEPPFELLDLGDIGIPSP